jgi:hypothetical protein
MPDYNTKFERLDAVMRDFLYRQQVTIIAGAPYAGKTSCIFKKVALPLATGSEDLLGGVSSPRRVLICSERDWKFNSEQLLSLSITSLPENLHIFCQPDIPKAYKARFYSNPLLYITEQVISKGFQPDIVILDTYQVFMCPHPSGSSINDYAKARLEMAYIKEWADTHNFAVLASFHSPKQNAKTAYDDPFQRIMGSTAYRGSTIGTAVLERCSDGFCRMYLESHIAKLESPRYFRYGDFAEVEDSVALASTIDGTEPKYLTLSEREAQYIKLVPQTPEPYAEVNRKVCKELGIELNNGRNIINRLIAKSLVEVNLAAESGDKFVKKVRPS